MVSASVMEGSEDVSVTEFFLSVTANLFCEAI